MASGAAVAHAAGPPVPEEPDFLLQLANAPLEFVVAGHGAAS